MSDVTYTPLDLSVAEKVGKLTYRKQILPLGTINYKGRKITFDKKYLTDLASSFKKGAYDQVPFQFADGENRHNMDPEKFRGEITALELAADGLDMVVSVTPAGAKAIKSNPRLGVSARIVEGLAKSNGKTYPRAIQHVLATMDPRVTGLRPWKAVDLSESDEGLQVVDLSTETYEETKVATTKTKAKGKDKVVARDGVLDLSSLSDEQFEALLDLASNSADGSVEVEDDDSDDEDEDEDEESDEEDEEADEDEVDEVDEDTKTKVVKSPIKSTDLSNGKKSKKKGRSVNLSAQVLASTDRESLKQMRMDLAADRFQQEKARYVDAGVPPHFLDLAEPLLSLPDAAVIDLSEDETLDATAVVRGMLDGLKGIVDLGVEVGHSVDLSDDGDEDSTEKALMEEWNKQYGRV